MIKNIKLMLVAALAMLSMNSFAADTKVITNGTAETGFTIVDGSNVNSPSPFKIEYKIVDLVLNEDKTVKTATVEAYAGAELKNTTTLAIPNTVEFSVNITGTANINQAITFTVVKISDNGFTGSKLTSVTLPNKLTAIGDNAFKDLALTEIELPNTLKTIGDNAFSGTDIVSVSVPATVEEIGDNAFAGSSLQTFTLAESSHLNSIGNGAFESTPLQKLDLSNAWYTDKNGDVQGMETFGSGTKSPLTDGTNKNGVIKTVILPKTCTTVADNAFKDCTKLNTIDLTQVATVGKNAFSGCAKLASVAIGTAVKFEAAKGISVDVKAFEKCTALASVELGKLKAADVADDAFEGCTALATFTFNEITAENAVGKKTSTSPYDLKSVITVNFKKYIGIVGAVAEGAFATNAFTADGEKYNIYYNEITLPKKDGDFKQPFATTAFGSSVTPRTITLTTLADQFTNTNGFSGNAELLNRVTIVSNYTANVVIGNSSQKLVKDRNSSYFYYYYAPATVGSKYKIAKKNKETGAEIKVYQAYVDESDEAVYYQPLMVKNGYYVIEGVICNSVINNAPNNIPFIIKSTTEDGVLAEATNDVNNTMIYNNAKVVNSLIFSGDNEYTLVDIANDGAGIFGGGDNDIFYFANPATAGYGFSKFDSAVQTKGIGKNTLFISIAAPVAAARLKNIWLDEEGNVTAIDGVETKPVVNNGAIYNLAGQQVDSSYKGVVIKNGKKMIQK